MSQILIYISKYPEALEIKIEAFLAEFRRERKKNKNLLHLKRAEYEIVQNSLTQLNLFNEYTHYIFEEYLGDFKELDLLFERIGTKFKLLITKTTETKLFLPWNLAQKLSNKEYSLFLPSFRLKEEYLSNLIERLQIKISAEYLEKIKREGFSSPFLIKWILTQLKLMVKAKEALSMEKLQSLIKANAIEQKLEHKHYFLNLYLAKKINFWVLFLKELGRKPRDKIIEFLRYFAFALNNYFWKDELEPNTQRFIQELSYNYLLFLERELFKIKSDSDWLLLYFFWKNQPKKVLVLNN